MKRLSTMTVCAMLVAGLVAAPAGAVDDPPPFDCASPLFDLEPSADGDLLVADAGQGIVVVGEETAELIVELPGVSGVVPSGDGDLIAITAEADDPPQEGTSSVFRISGENIELIADLWAFEEEENPDKIDPFIDDNVESNPWGLARIEDATLVADAAGNDLLIVDDDGTVDWMTVFPSQLASTAYLLDLVDCDDPPEDLGFVCTLPPQIPAEAVPTSVAVGPDGNYYVGELTGFPATPGMSRVWRVEPGTTNELCPSDGCTQVLENQSFSAIIDVAFGPDGTFYVLELDEMGFLAAEFGFGSGSTLNACKLETGSCVKLATGLFLSTATTVGRHGTIYATIAALTPMAGVTALGKEFDDDDGSVHELDIALLAAKGVTRGCNPPINDAFCPDAATTRGEMAAFIVRALGLPGSDEDHFGDDDGSVFQGDIDALAAAGVTRGCNPPDNDAFCPDREVTRGEMAAFLVRALGLLDSDEDRFVDDDGSVFQGDIDALAAAGVTRGCNPPDNDRFCPDDFVTRAQMASFLIRAITG